eukprot:4800369-Pyramimonas_sp.AAC.1
MYSQCDPKGRQHDPRGPQIIKYDHNKTGTCLASALSWPWRLRVAQGFSGLLSGPGRTRAVMAPGALTTARGVSMTMAILAIDRALRGCFAFARSTRYAS